MSNKTKITLAGISGFLAVALGAFGAHGLKSILETVMLETFRTGVLYHLIHSVVLLAIALSGRKEFDKSFLFILAGIILFSFSLYCYSISGIKVFALVTPFGGVSLLVGWGHMIFNSVKSNS